MAIPGHDRTRLSKGETGPDQILFCAHKWEERDAFDKDWIYEVCLYCGDGRIKSQDPGPKFPVHKRYLWDSAVRLKDIEWMTRTKKEWKPFSELTSTTEGERYMMLAVSAWT